MAMDMRTIGEACITSSRDTIIADQKGYPVVVSSSSVLVSFHSLVVDRNGLVVMVGDGTPLYNVAA